jgi:DNA-binding Xre family transcriptional regulator
MSTATVSDRVPVFEYSGQAVRRIRKERRMSSTDLGFFCGRSAFTIATYERGQPPPADVLGKICWALGCSPNDLFVATGETAPVPSYEPEQDEVVFGDEPVTEGPKKRLRRTKL